MSGPNCAEWIKATETIHDIPSGNAADTKPATEYVVTRIREDSVDVEEIVIGETQNDFRSAKSGVAKAWDNTKEMAENVTQSACNMGTDICDSVKHGAEAGWNKVTGSD